MLSFLARKGAKGMVAEASIISPSQACFFLPPTFPPSQVTSGGGGTAAYVFMMLRLGAN